MGSTRSIAILLHESDPFPGVRSHLIWSIAHAWRRMGIRVGVLKGVARPPPAAGLLVPHIDLTATPPEYREYIGRFPRVLNRGVMDISKRLISRNLLSRGDSFDGPVIVKTDLNFGGDPEKRLRQSEARVSPNASWADKKHLDPFRYPVFDHLSKVPAAVWSNPALVVERFIPEREAEYYCIRFCLFLGDVVLTRRIFSRSPIVKGDTIVRSEEVEPHPDLAAIRSGLGFDYGKFDYVEHDGRVQVLDANRTPGALSDGSVNVAIGAKLAAGIERYQGGTARAG